MILVLGAGGQLGRALLLQLGERAIGLDRAACDLSQAGFTRKLASYSPKALINAAAYTQVDRVESERELAMRINADAVGELAVWCKMQEIPLVHYSTDYVFDGNGTRARVEEDPTNPLNYYGASKLVGEQLLAASGADYLLFRTSWVYDAWGKNFPNTMLRLFSERESISVVADQIGAPTYAPHLARASLQALEAALAAPKFPTGIYHLCAKGECSWHGFAQAIFTLASAADSGIKCKLIQPITTAEYPTPAKRPLNSRLDCSKAKNMLSVALPDWQQGLQEWATERYETDRDHAS